MQGYRFPGWYRCLALVIAVIFDALASMLLPLFLFGPPSQNHDFAQVLVMAPIVIAVFGGGAVLFTWTAVATLRAKLTVTDGSVRFVGPFGLRVVERAAIAGRLILHRPKQESLLVLTGSDPVTPLLKCPLRVAQPALRETWIGALPDQQAALERRRAEIWAAARATLLADPRLGPSPEARWVRFRRARNFVRGLTMLALVAGLWLAIWPRPLPWVLAANILLMPVALAAITRPDRLIRVVLAPGAPPLIWIALAITGGALGLASANAPDLVNPLPVIGLGLLGGIAILAWMLVFDPGMRRAIPLLLTAPIAVLLAGGALDLANIAADRAAPRVFAVPVLQHWNGRRHNGGFLRIGPWGGRHRPQLVDVGNRLNAMVWPGVLVCVRLHPGAFGFRWYDPPVYCGPRNHLLAERTLLPSLRRRAAAGDMAATARLGIDLVNGVAGPGHRQAGLDLLYRAAGAEEPLAFYGLGMARLHGADVTADPERAAHWFAKAARTIPGAAWELGRLVETGRGVPRDQVRARRLYRRAAEAGQTDAAYRLGRMDQLGIGTAPDPARGMIWIRRAAEMGDARAMNDLGDALLTGNGVPRDTKFALAWLRAAATMGEPHAAQTLGARLLGRTGVLARERAYFWLRLAVMREVGDDPVRASAEKALQQAAAALSVGERGRVDQQVAAWRPRPVRPLVVSAPH